MNRLPIKTDVIRRLFALSGNQCAFPNCTHHLVNENGKFVGQICHIEAAKPGGERYNPEQSDEERRSFENLVLLCYEHHIVTDDVQQYPAAYLKEIKKNHEEKFSNQPYQLPPHTEEKILLEISEKIDEIHAINQEMYAMLQQMASSFATLTQSPAPDLSFIDEQLEDIKQLRKERKHQTVIDLLLKYRERNHANLTAEFRYRVVANLGITYLEMGKVSEASTAFKEIEQSEYETEDSLAYLALGYALANDHDGFDKVFEKARPFHSKNVNLWIAFIHAKEDKLDYEAILQEIPADLRQKPEILNALGEVLMNHDRFDEGLALLLQALENIPQEGNNVTDLKGMIASKTLQAMITPYKFLYRSFSQAEWKTIHDCVDFLSESWNAIADTELAKMRWYYLTNRGTARLLLGERDLAFADFQLAYRLVKNLSTFKNLCFHYTDSGKEEDAEKLIVDFLKTGTCTENEKFEVTLVQVRLLTEQGKTDDVVTILDPYLKDDYNILVKHKALQLIISSFFENERPEDALPFIKMETESFPNDMSSYLSLGDYYRSTGNKENAAISYEDAYNKVADDSLPFEIDMLASRFMQLGDWQKAISLYERIVDKSIFDKISRNFIYACYEQGLLHKALRLSLDLFEAYPKEPFLAEIIMNCYQQTDAYRNAILTGEQFLKNAPDDVRDVFLLRTAILYSFLNAWDKVKEFTNRIQKPERLSIDEIFRLAVLLIKTKATYQGIEVAYNARIKYYELKEAHEKYLATLAEADKDFAHEMFPEEVIAESAVTIKDVKNQTQFLITKGEGRGVSILNPGDGLAKLLMGKRVGNTVVQEKKYGFSQSYTIVEIVHKFIQAHRDAMELLSTRFADTTSFLVMHAGEGDEGVQSILEHIKRMSEEHESFFRDLLTHYNKKTFFIGVMAAMSQRNFVKQWLAMAFSSDLEMFCYTRNEMLNLETAIRNQSVLVLDLTSLLTLFFLTPAIHLLRQLKNRIVVSQATLDEINVFRHELEGVSANGFMTIGFSNGQYHRADTTPEDVQKQLVVLKQMTDWCEAHTDILPLDSAFLSDAEELKRRKSLFGDVCTSTILLAQGENATMICDDDPFKNLCAHEYRIPSFSTYELAIYCYRNGFISQSQLEDFLLHLALAGYTYIPLTTEILWKVFDASGFQIRPPFSFAIKSTMILRTEIAAHCFLGFAKRTFISALPPDFQEQVVLMFLNQLAERNDFTLVLPLIRNQVPGQFRLIPEKGERLLQIVATRFPVLNSQ